MGFRFRKYNPKGVNVSLSKNGLRLSKTVKFGGATFNIGKTFGGTNDKITTRSTMNFGNGVSYVKHHTLGKDSNASLSKTFNVKDETFIPDFNRYTPLARIFDAIILCTQFVFAFCIGWVVRTFAPWVFDYMPNLYTAIMCVVFPYLYYKYAEWRMAKTDEMIIWGQNTILAFVTYISIVLYIITFFYSIFAMF